MRTVEIDGNEFKDIGEFYDLVQAKFCPDFAFGRDLNGFNDVLRGGLGVDGGIEYQEKVHVIWRNSEKSRNALSYASQIKYFEKVLIDVRQHDESYMVSYAQDLAEKIQNMKKEVQESPFETIVSMFVGHGHTLELK